jgi:hypothetical protein
MGIDIMTPREASETLSTARRNRILFTAKESALKTAKTDPPIQKSFLWLVRFKQYQTQDGGSAQQQ